MGGDQRVESPVKKNPQRMTKELIKQSEELNWDGIEFPTPCLERVFKKFEKNNDVSLLMFGHETVMNNTRAGKCPAAPAAALPGNF